MGGKGIRIIAACVSFLAAGGASWALSPSLSSSSSDCIEFTLNAGWSPARGITLLGWQTTFTFGPQWAVSVDCLIDAEHDSGGYVTVNGVYYCNNAFPTDADLTVPLSAGIGLARHLGDVSLAAVVSGAVAWYPVSVELPAAGNWILGFGSQIEVSAYLMKWGVEPVLSASLMLPVNFTAIEGSSE